MKKDKLNTFNKFISGVGIVAVLLILLAMLTGFHEPTKLLISLLGLSYIFKSLSDFIPEVKEDKSK
ncbi:hypothetical protein MHB40_14410 [Lysinibacillus sp. FSL K6-0057]|uniref:hypothetical protein n=1 Tax=Lysinibacillus sp. FSL K6-0057 TaxID=2921411 RepID=UPI00315A0057